MNVNYKNFNHVTPIQIRFCDIDAMGHLNNAVYLSYYEIARIRYFNSVLQTDWDDRQVGLILAKSEVNYKMPVFFTDTIEVYVRCSRIGNKSFEVEYEMVKVLANGEKQIASTGSTVLVAFNYDTQQSIAVPQQWKETLVAFEQNPELVK
jgi:acyl-CoA thioester hydrolase